MHHSSVMRATRDRGLLTKGLRVHLGVADVVKILAGIGACVFSPD